MKSILLCRFGVNDDRARPHSFIERRLFENIWMIYAVALLTFLTSSTREIEIPMNISSRDQRNAFFATNLPKWECDFTQYWSNHSASRKCNDHCSKALVIDGFQKPDRFVYQFSGDVIQSPELGSSCIATRISRSIVFSGEIWHSFRSSKCLNMLLHRLCRVLCRKEDEPFL